jgi:hypothetical protein
LALNPQAILPYGLQITASVTQSGYEKMMANWIYEELDRR